MSKYRIVENELGEFQLQVESIPLRNGNSWTAVHYYAGHLNCNTRWVPYDVAKKELERRLQEALTELRRNTIKRVVE